VDVDPGIARQRSQHGLHRRRRYRAQAVQGTPHAQRGVLTRMQGFEQPQVTLDIVTKALLAAGQRAPIETAAHVQHRQQGQADAGFARGGGERVGHRRRHGIWPAVGRMVQVMELADRGVTGFEHLHVQLRGHRVQRVRIEARREPVHRLAPGPEAILGMGLAFGQARHRALERVRMQVGDAGRAPAIGHALHPGLGRGVSVRMFGHAATVARWDALGYRVGPGWDTSWTRFCLA
jgi:hypothetical protein